MLPRLLRLGTRVRAPAQGTMTARARLVWPSSSDVRLCSSATPRHRRGAAPQVRGELEELGPRLTRNRATTRASRTPRLSDRDRALPPAHWSYRDHLRAAAIANSRGCASCLQRAYSDQVCSSTRCVPLPPTSSDEARAPPRRTILAARRRRRDDSGAPARNLPLKACSVRRRTTHLPRPPVSANLLRR